ncbi:MAG: HEPN domain-containing protein [Clostridia bacterium]|nr:HEPN domain-containing protein [Clostridia bacterium]
MTLTMALIKADIIAAEQAIEYYNEHNTKDIKNIAAYHLQQAAEKLIKIQIYAKATNINNTSMYTHNLERLIAYAQSLNIDFLLPKYIADNSLVITGWEAGSRYNVDFQIRITTLNKTLSEIQDWYDALYATGIRTA